MTRFFVRHPINEASRSEDDWNWDVDALLCPVCERGEMVGEPAVSFAHLTRGWIDNRTERVEVRPDGRSVMPSKAMDTRGSEIGWECQFEQCEHVVEYRVRFHKGDVLFEWRRLEDRHDDHYNGPQFMALPRD